MRSVAKALKDCKAIRFGDFTLASGKKSRYYIDIKKASTNPKILKLIAIEIKNEIVKKSISGTYIGCVALGGVPIAVAVSLETGLPLVIVRKEKKDYGTKGQIIGDPKPGSSVILVEDVTTTGGSVLKAIEILKEEGLEVHYVLVVVDREEGASGNLKKNGVELIPLARINDLLEE
jgi:orotate phosphoribosyltransferase